MTEQLDDPVDPPVRRPARRRHGHQPRGGLLPVVDPRSAQHHPCAHFRPLRRRRGKEPAPTRQRACCQSGVQVITLLALSNEGTPFYDKALAAKLAGLGIPSFACTPDLFPGMMAAAIRKEDVNPGPPNRVSSFPRGNIHPPHFWGGTTASLRASPPIKQPPGSSVTKNRAFFILPIAGTSRLTAFQRLGIAARKESGGQCPPDRMG